MGMPTSKKKAGLGKALMRSRFTSNTHVNPDGSIRHTAEVDDSTTNWTKMQSITQENDLEAFLSTAQLAGTDFTAEKMNITVISNAYNNPYLLTPEEEQQSLQQQKEHKHLLTVPRRPPWDSTTTPDELKRRENISFLEWRRGLVTLEEDKGLLMTPYERNLEVWRQLWRVIERSDLIVQIVDSRNPVLFRSTDLEAYVKEVDPRKKNLLLVNKADMLTIEQRLQWADYFDAQGIQYTFFSAALAREKLEAEDEARKAAEALAEAEKTAAVGDGEESDDDSDDDDEPVAEEAPQPAPKSTRRGSFTGLTETANESDVPERARIIGAEDLIALLERECPESLRPADSGKHKSIIGFVGYPNVGKSSTLNALVGAKKVTVSSTPGKTKHFQTIHLSEDMILCDCPGLVFPSFTSTKADLVCNGILPIDQLREFTGPSHLVAQRVPKWVLENVYGMRIRTKGLDGEDEDRQPTGTELLMAYAIARGFTKSSQGNPDEARAARYILKDYVNGKVLYAHPPPGIDSEKFNEPMYASERFKRRKVVDPALAMPSGGVAGNKAPHGSATVDKAFFEPTEIRAGWRGGGSERQQGA
ncbi:P-loop containing nucleoside triphosphate hydrolase protein [Gaertneriomyces semiglobifer]|nr:P-loop containing nucleoside triphosphate hydrolase protein [Gaertneriomyces semiglobifer]